MNGKWGHWIQFAALVLTFAGGVWLLGASIHSIGDADAARVAALAQEFHSAEDANQTARFSLAQQFQSAENTNNGKISALEAQRQSDHELWQLMLGEIKSIHEEVASIRAAASEKRK